MAVEDRTNPNYYGGTGVRFDICSNTLRFTLTYLAAVSLHILFVVSLGTTKSSHLVSIKLQLSISFPFVELECKDAVSRGRV